MRKEIFESEEEMMEFLKECVPDDRCLTDDEIVLKAKSLNLIKKSIVEEAEELSKKNKRLLSIMEILLSIETLEYHDKNFLSFQPCLNIMRSLFEKSKYSDCHPLLTGVPGIHLL